MHQLRHAGPSYDHVIGRLSLEEIKLRGRWESDRSVARYKKSGRINEQVAKLEGPVRDFWERSLLDIEALLMQRSFPLPLP